MKFLKSFDEKYITELFDNNYNNIKLNHIENGDNYYLVKYLYITIDKYDYIFTFQIKKGYVYFSYHLIKWSTENKDNRNNNSYDINFGDSFTKYDYVINDSMMIKVLNSLPIILSFYIKTCAKEGLGDTEINGIYYDADENRRARIYKYFFSKKLPNSVYRKDSFIYFTLPETIELKDFKL